MKRLLVAALAAVAVPALAGTNVGVSIEVAEPGMYGRIDIGRFPQPQVVVAQPVVIQPVPRTVIVQPVQPVYLWVPPGHRNNWGKHCRRYNACSTPVYFVRDEWYQQHVTAGPRGYEDHGKGHGKGKGKKHRD